MADPLDGYSVTESRSGSLGFRCGFADAAESRDTGGNQAKSAHKPLTAF